jgi:hypothetical protein
MIVSKIIKFPMLRFLYCFHHKNLIIGKWNVPAFCITSVGIVALADADEAAGVDRVV